MTSERLQSAAPLVSRHTVPAVSGKKNKKNKTTSKTSSSWWIGSHRQQSTPCVRVCKVKTLYHFRECSTLPMKMTGLSKVAAFHPSCCRSPLAVIWKRPWHFAKTAGYKEWGISTVTWRNPLAYLCKNDIETTAVIASLLCVVFFFFCIYRIMWKVTGFVFKVI